MKNYLSLIIFALISSLIGCSSNVSSSPSLSSQNQPSEIEALPSLPINPDLAFFPLRRDSDNIIKPSYQWRECVKKLIVCLEWKTKTVFINDLEWFLANGYGLTKRKQL